MAEEQATQVETPEPQEPELVPIPEATDEDLTTFINASAEVEEQPEAQEEPEAPPSEAKPAEPAVAQPQQPEAQPKKLTEEEIKAKAVGLIRQVEGQERLVQNQISRLAEFKKELKAKVEALAEGLDDKYLENPRQAFKDELAIKEAQDTMNLIDQESSKLEKRGKTVKVLAQHIKPEEWSEEDIALSLREDSIPPDQIQVFLKDPLAYADAPLLIQLSRRARAEKALRIIVPEYEKLRKEVEQLRATAANATKDVLKNIEAAAATPPRINGKAATRTPRKPNIEDPSTLTDSELEELLHNSD